jgi:hypothetical protein
MSGLALVRRRGPKGPLARTTARGLKNLSTLKTYNHNQMICSKVIYALKVVTLNLSFFFFSLGKTFIEQFFLTTGNPKFIQEAPLSNRKQYSKMMHT